MCVSPLLISAIGVNKVCELIKSGKIAAGRQRILSKVFIVVLCLSALNLLTSAFGNQFGFLLPDTRVVSQSFAEKNDIDESNTVFEGYTTFKTNRGGFTFGAFEEIDGKYYLKDPDIKYIILSSEMFGRIKKEPDRYHGEAAFYRSLEENFTEIKRFEAAYRKTSPIEVVNTIYAIIYFARAADAGQSGPTLIFYEASEKNYIR